MSLVVDRRSAARPSLDVAALLGEASTRVVALTGDRFAVTDEPALQVRAPRPGDAEAEVLVYLGEDDAASPLVGVVNPAAETPESGTATLRDVGPWMAADHVEVAMTVQGMAGWHRTHLFCPRCGAPTQPASAGWVRRCTADGKGLFPRTDPAVIMAVTDDAGRLLLGRGPSWPEGRRSVQAGFVEPGECLEDAVRREVAEEVGLVVGDVDYVASQSWPFPASLMLGFTARATTTELVLDPGEIAEAEWWTRDALTAAVAAETITLPGRMSIARRLIEDWYGGPLVVPSIDRPGGDAWARPAT